MARRRSYSRRTADLFGSSAQAQNLTDKVQQLPQRPVGFADIVEKVKPAVISVRVKLERPASAGPGDDDLPFPPGSPFERFFRKFGGPNAPGGKEVVTGQGSGFFISADGYRGDQQPRGAERRDRHRHRR